MQIKHRLALIALVQKLSARFRVMGRVALCMVGLNVVQCLALC